MKANKIISLIISSAMILIIAFCLSACQTKQQTEVFDYQIVYTNNTNDDVIYSGYNLVNKDSNDTQEIVEELLNQLFKVNNEDTVHYSPLPQTISYNSCSVSSDTVTVDLSEGYTSLSNVQQQILKACVGLTLAQVEGIEKFTFTENGKAITLNDGSVLEEMKVEQFVKMVPSDGDMTIQQKELKIYFSNKAGNLLVPLDCTVALDNPDASAEEYILNLLQNGCNEADSDCIPTIDPEVEVISVSTVDGVCYVNFNDTFLNQALDINDEVKVYSIVDSLCSLTYINSVQFLVNGQSGNNLHLSIDLSKPLIFNKDIVQS